MVLLHPTGAARVSFLPLRAEARMHELAAYRAVAQQLALLLGCEFVADAHMASPSEAGYVVPDDTFTSLEAAQRWGVGGEDDFFGGVVPWPYMAGKTISHPLVGPSAVAPEGWCAEFADRVRDAVLPGYSAFSGRDARVAAQAQMREGPVRLKLASGIGGSGQSVVHDEAALESALAAFGESKVRPGLVVEPDLQQVRTYSVGRVRIGSLEASYVGEQRTTRNRAGIDVYGGSVLTLVRGGLDRLAALVDDGNLRQAVDLARTYHRAAIEELRGMFASRCNYDVVHGVDAHGRWRMGVLEQSWRIGGASGAEAAALQAFADDASLQVVRASTVETYDDGAEVPAGATVSFQGVDPHVGPITKYAMLHPDG
jgi:hypothetical protein